MVRSFFLSLLMVLLLAACQGPGEEAGNGSAETGAAQSEEPVQKRNETISMRPEYGGRIVEPMLGEPSNLIPFLATDSASHQVADLIFVAPLRYDKNIKLEPWAAESYEILDEGKLLKFKLREDIRWTDGEPLTAEDVEFTYEVMVDPKTPTAYASDYMAIREFRRTGKYSFEVEYNKTFARALITWAHSIMPKHLLGGQDLTSTDFSRKPVGAGPYKLKEWTAGSRLVLEANDDYFLGRPYIDEVVYRIIPDQATQFLELKARNLDIMSLTPQQYLFQTKGPFWEENFNKYKYLSFGYTYLGYNPPSPVPGRPGPPGHDLRHRQAGDRQGRTPGAGKARQGALQARHLGLRTTILQSPALRPGKGPGPCCRGRAGSLRTGVLKDGASPFGSPS